jgi:hypothetical protein
MEEFGISEVQNKNLQFKLSPVTGKTYGENNMATTQPFQKMPMNWKGLLSLPRFHRGLGKLFGVRKNLPKQIKPYAAAEGTPAAEIREVKATPDGRIVQVTMLAMPQTTRTALRGWPSAETCETQPEKGRTPSRATAKTRREAATMAIIVF